MPTAATSGDRRTPSTMKRTLLTAAFAALLLGAAQATTVNWSWTSQPTLPSGNIAGNLYTSLYNGVSEKSILVNSSVTSISALSIAAFSHTRGGAELLPANIFAQVRNAAGETVATSSVTVFGQTEYHSGSYEGVLGNGVVFQFAFENSFSMESGYTIHIVNAEGNATEYALAVASGSPTDFTVKDGASTVDRYAPYIGYGTAEIDTTTIPEPTALALLALGVAGVALRRRVA